MNTGLVLSRPAQISENYGGLVKYNVKISFIAKIWDHRYFKYAENHSSEEYKSIIFTEKCLSSQPKDE